MLTLEEKISEMILENVTIYMDISGKTKLKYNMQRQITPDCLQKYKLTTLLNQFNAITQLG
jgi:hypothetical protein